MTQLEDSTAAPSGPRGIDIKLISIVAPVYNEVKNIRPLYDEIVRVFDQLPERYDFEIVFTDNCSQDQSFEEIEALADKDCRVRGVRFARNFGFHRSVLTGYRAARGAAAIQVDADQQDPPALIPRFIELWEEGHDVVVGIRSKRHEARWLSRARTYFYRFLNAISEHPLLVNGGDFRLIDRTVLDQLNDIHDAEPYIRGIVSSLAARETGFTYERSTRTHGESKFPLSKLLRFAASGIIAHSTVPLRVATLLGLLASLGAALLGAFFIVSKLCFGQSWPSGFATLSVLILFGIGLNGLFLGVIGEYLARIYLQLQRRPNTVIRKSVNWHATQSEPAKASG